MTGPTVIVDVRAAIESATQVTLKWTSPADSNNGPIASYTVRYLTGAACNTGFDFTGATTITQSISPQPPGQTESLTTNITSANAEAICFAIESTDLASNTSAISNVAYPPSAISDLTANTVDDTHQELLWTAPGGDFTTGSAASYQLSFAAVSASCPAQPIDVLALGSLVTTSSGLPMPATGGTPDTGAASGLSPDTHYCLVLRATDAQGNSALSNVLSVTTPDTTPPAQVTGLTANPGSRSSVLLWNASGDDGLLGAASSYRMRWASGSACATFDYDTSTNQIDFVPTPPLPSPANNDVVQINLGTTPNTLYCFAVTAADEHGNRSVVSATATFTSAPDGVPPAALTLLAAAPNEVTSTGGVLRFTAVADDGTDASTGRATAYDLRFVTAPGGSCASLTAADYASAAAFTPQPAPVAAPGALETVSLTFSGPPSSGQPFCVAATALDAAGNPSPVSNWIFYADNTPPAFDGTISVTNTTSHGGTISLHAPGNDGLSGQARIYLVRYSANPNCAQFDFNAATTLMTATPSAPPATDTITITTLDYSTGYCIGIMAEDFLDNKSTPITVSLTTNSPQPGAQITAIQQTVSQATSVPVALNNALIDAAIVTYVKAAVNGAAVGTGDGPGFFLQDPGSQAAIYVAMDPAAFIGGVSVGDRLDLVATQATWVACGSCGGSNSLPAITAATGTRRATGVSLPPGFNATALTTTTWPLPTSAQVPWTFGAALENSTGTITTAPLAQGDGFSKMSVTTTGVTTTNAFLQLRVPDAVANTFHWQSGMKFAITARPMWRTGGEADLAAWTTGDVAVSPVVLNTSIVPPDGAMLISAPTQMSFTFSQPVQPVTVTMQAANGPCTGSVQVTVDGNNTNCVGGTVSVDVVQTTATIAFAAPLNPGTRYLLRTTGGITGVNSLAALASAESNGFETRQSASETCGTNKSVVISQVYGGGGNSGAVYKNDFIELHNRGSTTVNLTGWSVQYASAGGSSWQVTALGGSIAPGGYYLVQEGGTVDGGTTSLPTPQATGTINMSGTAGKVLLSSAITAQTGSCPIVGTGNVVDIVGFGNGNSCGTPTAVLSNTTSAQRNNVACNDTATAFIDFSVAGAAPRNNASTADKCSCDGTNSNVTGQGAGNGEVNYCVLQYPNPNNGYTGPIPITAAPGAPVPDAVQTGVSFIYGQLFQSGLTPTNGGNAAVQGEVGVFPAGTNPLTQTVWYPAAYNVAQGNNDEFQRAFPAPSLSGSYGIFYRFTVDSGAHWTWCDMQGNGTNGGLQPFDTGNYLPLTVQ